MLSSSMAAEPKFADVTTKKKHILAMAITLTAIPNNFNTLNIKYCLNIKSKICLLYQNHHRPSVLHKNVENKCNF